MPGRSIPANGNLGAGNSWRCVYGRQDREAISLLNYPDLGEKTYRVIKDRILAGEFDPGSRLVVVELAQELGVSRSPVKDALNLLVGEGLVEQVPGKAFVIATADANSFSQLLDFSSWSWLQLSAVFASSRMPTSASWWPLPRKRSGWWTKTGAS